MNGIRPITQTVIEQARLGTMLWHSAPHYGPLDIFLDLPIYLAALDGASA